MYSHPVNDKSLHFYALTDLVISIPSKPDENILSSPSLIANNLVVDELLKRKVLDKDINVEDIVEEDRQAILFFLRNTAFGSDYEVIATDPKTDETFTTKVNTVKESYFSKEIPEQIEESVSEEAEEEVGDEIEGDEESVRKEAHCRARQLACDGQQSQAEEMTRRSKKKLDPIKIGDTVLVPISQFDRSRASLKNLLGIATEGDDSSGYIIKTKYGILDTRLFNGFILKSSVTLTLTEDSPNNILSIRAAAKQESVGIGGTGQGYSKCNCTGTCQRRTCSCKKNSLKCSTHCHPNGKKCLNKL